MPSGLVRHYVDRDPGLVLAAVPHFQERFADRTLPAIRSRVRYMRGCLNRPEDYGFMQEPDGRWLRAQPEGEAARRAEQDERAKRAASEQALKQQRDAEERSAADRNWRAWMERWQGMSASDRDELIREVRRQEPMFTHGKKDEDFAVLGRIKHLVQTREKQQESPS